MIISSKSRKCIHSSTPFLPIALIIQKLCDLHRTLADAHNIQLRLRITKRLDDMVEDVIDMLGRALVTRDSVLLLIKAVRKLNSAVVRQRVPTRLSNGLLSASPPTELSHVGQDNARGIRERLDVFDHVDSRANVDTAFTADNAVGEDAEVLVVFVEEDDNSLRRLDVGRDEDRDMGIGFLGIEGKTDLGEVEGSEAVGDDSANRFCEDVRFCVRGKERADHSWILSA
jgi:hypothetical protein